MLVICENCGELFEKKNSEVRRTTHHFCSRSCSATINNSKTPKRRYKKICNKCEAPIKKRLMTCSECSRHAIVWSKITLNDVRGKANYQKHSYIRSLARTLFKRLNRGHICERCGYIKHTDVCHYPHAISSFPMSALVKDINAPSNLLAFCPNCHWELDHGLISNEEITEIRSKIPVLNEITWRGITISWY